ncbi:hypothetical protein ACFE33_06635 [Falsihalocynthiibacter sp. SS001]|uniref:hypothetical protein n=1 Tax=Falsihalocynthiibacter sp. SS001 TaxID=3349698 RepID=UPI0036D38021
MRRSILLAIAISSSTSGVLAQEQPLTLTNAPLGMSGEFGLGNIGQTGETDMQGVRVGISGAYRLRSTTDWPLILEFGIARTTAEREAVTRRNTSAGAPSLVTTRINPTGTADISTDLNSSGNYSESEVAFTDNTNDGATIFNSTFSPSTGQSSVFAFSTTEAGGGISSVVADGFEGSAGATGAFFDETGAVLLSSGQNGETTLTNKYRESVGLTDAGIRLSTVMQMGNGWNLSPRGGLVLQTFDRTTSSINTLDTEDGFETINPTPDISLATYTGLESNMNGLSIGLGVSKTIFSKWNLSLSADVGAMHRESSYYVREAVSYNNTQVMAIKGPSRRVTGQSNLARISMGVSHPLRNGGIFSVRAFSDLTTDVPYLSVTETGNTSAIRSGSQSSIDVAGEENRIYELKNGRLRNSGVSVGLVFLF